jgi:hypothetical protein
MSLRTTASISIASLLLTQLPIALSQQVATQQPASPSPSATTVVVPSGTLVPLNLANPIKHKSTTPGDTVRATVAFPITVGDQIAIPAGTAVEGTITAPAKGKKPANQPPVVIHFRKLVYANGYSVLLDATNTSFLSAPGMAPAPQTPQIALLDLPPAHGPSPTDDYLPEPQTTNPPTVTDPYAHAGPTTKELVAFTVGPIVFAGVLFTLFHLATPHGDYIVEPAGWQFQLVLQNPLPVDIARVNAAAVTPAP